MKDKDTQRRDPDHLVVQIDIDRPWINQAGEPVDWVNQAEKRVEWVFNARSDSKHPQAGRDIGIGTGKKFIIFPKVTREVKVPTGEKHAAQSPPALGEALLVLFCSKNRARHVMGDLEEIFHEDIETKGKSRAKLLYWMAVLRSIGPLLWRKVRKAGFVALLLEIGRRWGGLS